MQSVQQDKLSSLMGKEAKRRKTSEPSAELHAWRAENDDGDDDDAEAKKRLVKGGRASSSSSVKRIVPVADRVDAVANKKPKKKTKTANAAPDE